MDLGMWCQQHRAKGRQREACAGAVERRGTRLRALGIPHHTCSAPQARRHRVCQVPSTVHRHAQVFRQGQVYNGPAAAAPSRRRCRRSGCALMCSGRHPAGVGHRTEHGRGNWEGGSCGGGGAAYTNALTQTVIMCVRGTPDHGDPCAVWRTAQCMLGRERGMGVLSLTHH
jgi:hypothetical protein